jgi:hypothetical protein
MTSLVRTAAICCSVLSLVMAAGCGGDTASKNDYVEAINKAQTDFANNVQKVGSSSNAGSDPAAAAKETFANLGTAIDKVVADLKGVEAPEDVKALHNDLISEMEEFKGQVQDAAKSLDSGDATAVLKAQSKFAQSASTLGTRISKTISDINTKLQD